MAEKKESKITKYKPPKSAPIERDGKLFIVHFDRVFGHKKMSSLKSFFIKKGSYENQLDIITKYANFFVAEYDTENELLYAYLKLKFALDKWKLFNESNMSSFIDFIYDIMFTDTICEKIRQMVEDNYLDDIEQSEDGVKKYSAKEKKHLESLEFTNEHVKILLQISFAMKIMSPVMLHYFSINVIDIGKDTDHIYQFYKRLFPLFGRDVDMYNKLYVYTKTKVLENRANNELIFQQREIQGIDEMTVIEDFTRRVLISENMVKYKFNEHYDAKKKKYKENIIGFNKTILKFQLGYFRKESYEKTLTEVTTAKNAEGLSGIDKLYMNMQKRDEGDAIMADVNIETTIERLRRIFDIPITEEEMEYYINNYKPHPLQLELICNWFGKYFGSYRTENILSRRQIIQLMLILKKKMLIEEGHTIDKFSKSAKLPYILTGNLADKVSTRLIRNTKFNSRIEENEQFEEIQEDKYSLLEEIDENITKALLSKIINTDFTYCVYEAPELLGTPIECDMDKLSSEALRFVRSF